MHSQIRDRFLAWCVVSPLVIGAMLLVNGVVNIAVDALAILPRGIVSEVKMHRGFDELWLQHGASGYFPHDVLALADPYIHLKEGDKVGKTRWSLTYELNDLRLGGAGWYVRTWVFGAQVWIPALVVALALALYYFRYQSLPRLRDLRASHESRSAPGQT